MFQLGGKTITKDSLKAHLRSHLESSRIDEEAIVRGLYMIESESGYAAHIAEHGDLLVDADDWFDDIFNTLTSIDGVDTDTEGSAFVCCIAYETKGTNESAYELAALESMSYTHHTGAIIDYQFSEKMWLIFDLIKGVEVEGTMTLNGESLTPAELLNKIHNC